MEPISFRLNGRSVNVEGVDPHTTLLQYLRQSGLIGTKEGCAEGECGACAVLQLVRAEEGARYQALNSCLLLIPMADGHQFYTVEGLAGEDGALHPVQSAMAQAGGSQCGYCTPGFVMSMAAEYYRPDRTEFDEEALSGNLCRCTGYRPIREAARGLGRPDEEDPLLERLEMTPPTLPVMVYQHDGERFFRPGDLAELFALMADHPEHLLVAGATDVSVEVNQRFRRWPVLISLEGVRELCAFDWGESWIEIGAALSLTDVEARVKGRLPLLEQLLPLFASPLIRNRATLGGSLATASPIGDAAPVLLALGAEIRLASAWGQRTLPVHGFFRGYRKTAMEPGEVIHSIRIPLPLPTTSHFYKVSKRRRDDISTVAAAFALRLDEGGRVSMVRLAYGGVAATPARALKTEAALLGQPWTEASLRGALGMLDQEFSPLTDHRGSDRYRRQMINRLLEKFFAESQGVAVCDLS